MFAINLQVSVSVQMTLERSPYNGAPRLRVARCAASIGYLNVYIINGGLIGDVINNNFRGKIIAQAQAMLPAKICGMLPLLVDERVNTLLSRLPQAIPLMQMVSYSTALTAKPHRLPEHVSHYHLLQHRDISGIFSQNHLFSASDPRTEQAETSFELFKILSRSVS
ncbi:unnamed protein product [Gongylonema pulchrum]|uniref:BPI1 domain-containing protein n=1 Tax=Gongylonema pulchrum TaxID=637853 RepID=A0A183CV75_9BILA|nr:unnamed protein product [Gongylonema pulchrum]